MDGAYPSFLFAESYGWMELSNKYLVNVFTWNWFKLGFPRTFFLTRSKSSVVAYTPPHDLVLRAFSVMMSVSEFLPARLATGVPG